MTGIDPTGLPMSPKSLQGLGGLDAGKLGASQKLDKNLSSDGELAFENILSTYIDDVNQSQVSADESIRQLAAGENSSIQDVVTKLEEADVAFQMMKEVRNKLLDAYKEVMNIQS